MAHAFAPIPVESPDDPRIAEYRQLRENRLPRPLDGAPHGVFIAEGEKVVRLLLSPESRFRARSVLIAESRLETDGPWLAERTQDTAVFTADRAVMDAVVGFPIHRGIVASGIREPLPSAEELTSSAGTLLVCEAIANHDNLGGLFRAAAALADRPAVLLDPESCDPLYRKAIRVSMGHALRVPFTVGEPWPEALDHLRGSGWSVVALTTHPNATPLSRLERPARPARAAWLVGAEGPGLSEAALTRADRRVRIPMQPGVDSLNVVTAAAIALAGD